VSVVDLSRRPSLGTGGIGDNSHSSLLKSYGQSAGRRSSSPSSDDAILSTKVSSTGGSHGGVSGVGVGWDVAETKSRNIVGVSRVSVVRSASVRVLQTIQTNQP